MMMMPVFLAVSLLVSTSCDSEDESTYNVTVVWTIGGQKGICEQPLAAVYGGGTLFFDNVDVKVYKSDKDKQENKPYRNASPACSDGSFIIEDIERGTYIVTLEAMAEDPDSAIDLSDAGLVDEAPPETRAYYVAEERITVPAADGEDYTFSLIMGQGAITVSWDFVEGGLCAVNEVHHVVVSIDGAQSEDDSGDILCDQGQFSFDDVEWDVYDVSVEGFDSNGNQTHYGEFDSPIEIRPGMTISGRDGLIHLAPTTAP